jgi:ABC-type branched-subunit amino acid transport system ATPase component/branched-subunit amino acid ABC-type transport system permease component
VSSLAFARVWAEIRRGLAPKRLAQVAGVLAGAWLVLEVLLPLLHTSHTSTGRWQSPSFLILQGVIAGLTYGLLAVGLVLVYRSNRVINFAHGQIGAFGAAFFGVEVVKWHLPYLVALVPALAVAAATGAVSEAAVVRRLRKAPLVMSVVVTLGLGQFLLLFAAVFNSTAGAGSSFPQPSFMPSWHFGTLVVTPAYTGILVFSPVVVLAVGLFLKLSRFGRGIRAAADNPEAARMSGIFASRMSTLSWAIAGALAAFSAILAQPTMGFITGDAFGPRLLLLALTGAVLARMQSLPLALVWGVAIGVLDKLLFWNYSSSGLVEFVLFLIILAAMLIQKARVGRAEDKGSWSAVQAARPLPRVLARLWPVRLAGPVIALAVGVFLVLLPLGVTNSTSAKVTASIGVLIVALSIGVVTGLGGQLSLGQFGVGAVGAVAAFRVSVSTGNVLEAFLYAALASALTSIVIGLPAIRVKGLLLTVTTLAFGLVVPDYLMQQPWFLGRDAAPPAPTIFGHALATGHSYYYLGLVILIITLVLARNVRRGGIGRRLVAVRDNEDAARAFTVPAAAVKLQGFAIAGVIAGLGAAMVGQSLPTLSGAAFPISLSLNAVAVAVIGGLSLLSGPFIGAAVVQGATFLPLDSLGLAATALGQLLIILYFPSGLGGLVTPLRDRWAGFWGRRAGIDVEAAFAAERGFAVDGGATARVGTEAPAVSAPRVSALNGHHSHRRLTAGGDTILEATGLVKSFGGVRAVRGVDLHATAGETVGLIGPNGAGKTTTFELLAGFTTPDAGKVRYAGRDITELSPEARGRLGLIRSFQDAALFPTLTVVECVQLALERTDPTQLSRALLGLRGQDRRKAARAEELVAWMGLERYRSSQVQELSTGTRRIAEIACLVALEPRVLLLDEPSSGVAQRETEALGALLQRLKGELDLTLVIIEHDIPLIMGLSDRIVCMAEGEVIAAGTPAVVRTDPAVVEAYLGGSLAAIERSSTATAGGAGRPARPRAKRAVATGARPTRARSSS